MNIAMGKAKKIARGLLCENLKKDRSWRKIASEDYGDMVNYATLNRFANSKGTWIPKNEKILVALGLKKPCEPKQPHVWLPGERWVKKKIAAMAKVTRQAVLPGK